MGRGKIKWVFLNFPLLPIHGDRAIFERSKARYVGLMEARSSADVAYDPGLVGKAATLKPVNPARTAAATVIVSRILISIFLCSARAFCCSQE